MRGCWDERMLTLILGGARSGKSDLAERLATASGGPVLFIATMEPGDDETRARIAAHRARRPATWRTIEEPLDVLGAVRTHAAAGDFVIIDCATLWVSNLLIAQIPDAGVIAPEAARTAIDDVTAHAGELAEWCLAFDGNVAVVSNEVGAGIVPPYPLGRVFRDALGASNRIVAERADRVYYLVAGLTLELKSLGAATLDTFSETQNDPDPR
jgi:adenosylcobinamide kinase/adenosylcobinamide-phosphate guanylyltransferase